MKNDRIIIAATLVIIISICSCGDNSKRKIAGTIRGMQEHVLTIPNDLIAIRNGDIRSMTESASIRHRLIVYYDSTDCTSCNISHLHDFHPLFSADSSLASFQLLVIFSPIAKENKLTVEEICYKAFPYTVYVDTLGSFARLNPFLPESSLYHTILCDEKGKILLVGNPLSSAKMWELFINIIK